MPERNENDEFNLEDKVTITHALGLLLPELQDMLRSGEDVQAKIDYCNGALAKLKANEKMFKINELRIMFVASDYLRNVLDEYVASGKIPPAERDTVDKSRRAANQSCRKLRAILATAGIDVGEEEKPEPPKIILHG